MILLKPGVTGEVAMVMDLHLSYRDCLYCARLGFPKLMRSILRPLIIFQLFNVQVRVGNLGYTYWVGSIP